MGWHRLLLTTLLTLPLLSCQRQDAPPDDPAKGDLLAVITEGPKVRWNLGDQLWVGGKSCYATRVEETRAWLSAPEGQTAPDAARLEAFYPFSLMEEGTTPLLPPDQEYSPEGLPRAPLYAVSETKQLDFKMLTGILEVSLTASAPLHIARLSLRSEKAMSGRFRVNTNGAAEVSGNIGALYMQPDRVLDQGGKASFFFCVPEGTYARPELRITTADGEEMAYRLEDGLSIERARTTTADLAVDADDFIPLNCIRYTSSDGQIITPYGMTPVSNTYTDGCGVMVFASPVTTLASHAFDHSDGYCKDADRLTGVSLPRCVKTFGPYLFQNCTALRQFKIPRGEEFTTLPANLFWGCTALEEVFVPDNVTKINNNAFQNCTSLRKVCLPDALTAIPQNTFNGCTALEDVNIPKALTTLGVKAFMATAISAVRLPAAVSAIPSQTFQNCSRLETVTLERDATDGITSLAAANVFSGCAALVHIYVPASALSAYKEAPLWSAYSEIISADAL